MRITVTQWHLPYYRFRCIVTYCNPGKCMWPTSPVLIGTRPPRYLLVKTEKRQQRRENREQEQEQEYLNYRVAEIYHLVMLIQFYPMAESPQSGNRRQKKAPGMTH